LFLNLRETETHLSRSLACLSHFIIYHHPSISAVDERCIIIRYTGVYSKVTGISLVSFAAITLCVASQRASVVVVYFVNDSVRKLLDTPSYVLRFTLVRFLRSCIRCTKFDG